MLPLLGQMLYYTASILGLLSVGLFLYKKNKETGLFLIAFYLIYSLVTDTIVNRFIEIAYGDASLGPRLFTISEFIILSLFIYKKIKTHSIKKLMLPLGVVFSFVCFYDFYTSPKNQLDSLSIGTSAIIILFYLIFYLYEQLNFTTEGFLYEKSDFWIIAGLVMYTAGTFFTLITSESKFTEENFRATYMLILSSFTLVRNLLFLIGFYMIPKRK